MAVPGRPTAPAVASALQAALSEERLRPFRGPACTLADALRLYRWNVAVSSALFEVLGTVEVAVRVAVDAELAALAPSGRWEDRPWWLFDGVRHDDLRAARGRARGRRDRHAALVANLSLGWWTDLLGPRHEPELWAPALRHAFPRLPAGTGRSAVHEPLARLVALRNRIAHHEPVHDLPLEALHDDALAVLGWICPLTQDWAFRTSRVPGLLEQDPRALLPDRNRSPPQAGGRPACPRPPDSRGRNQ